MTGTKPEVYKRKIREAYKEIPKRKARITKHDLLAICPGFFLSMAMPIGGMAPFGMAFLAQERKFSLKAVLSLAAVSAGSIAVCGRLDAAKYICAGLIYLAMLFVLEKGIVITDVTAGLAAGASVLVTGVAALIIRGFAAADFVLLLCETAIVASAALMMEKSGELLKNGSFSAQNMDTDTKLSLGAVAAVMLLSLKQLYIGAEFSVMNCVAAVMLLTVASGCGASCSTGTGVVLGILCGIGGDYFMPVLGAYSFCGFLAGVLSKFGKGGVIAGIIVANAVMVVYTNSAAESVLSIFEVMASAVVFAVLPQSISEAVRDIMCIGTAERESIIRIREGLKAKLTAVAAAFENMSGTLERLSEKRENTVDAAVVFDAAADKVCRKCRKSPICWGRDFNSTYHELFGMLDALRERGKVGIEDVRERLCSGCLNLDGLLTELNHQYDLYRVRMAYNNKLTEGREVVGEQLSGMSKIIDSLAAEVCEEKKPAEISSWEIRARLERRGIKVKDIKVIRGVNGRQSIELVLKTAFCRDKRRRTLEKIMKTVLKCYVMKIDEVSLDKKYTHLCFSEGERYRVDVQHASQSASKQSGDSFRMLHLDGGKFVAAISDGMGTGSRAARESEAMLELLDSLLQSGFDSRTAMRLINSIMLMKSDDNAFVTIDLCIVDLYTGEVKFIKTGAEPSFIMQKDGGVETVSASALPVGIIREAEADVMSMRVCDGDSIVMITDGIENRESGSLWVSEFINKSCRNESSTNVAKNILNYAIAKNSGEIKDDMTVLALSLKAVS